MFSTATALLAVLTTASATVDVSDVVIDESKISGVTESVNGAESGIDGKWFGMASIKPDYVAYLKSSAGINPFLDDIGRNTLIQTSFLTSSSHYHQDHLTPGLHDKVKLGGKVGFFPRGSPLVPSGDRVGMISLKTSENAYFDIDELCISLEEGKLIQFDGRRPHRTVVNSGSVSLLGPFHFKTMTSVWGAEPECGDCTGFNGCGDACQGPHTPNCHTSCTFVDPDDSLCKLGCVYHRETPGNPNYTCMCVGCEGTCGLDNANGNIFANGAQGKIPVVGLPVGSCQPDFSELPCTVVGSGARRKLHEGEDLPVREDMSLPDIHDTIDSLEGRGASHDAAFFFQYDLITKESCNVLIKDVDEALESDLASGKELPVYLMSKTPRENEEEKKSYESWVSFKDGGINNSYSKTIYADDLVKMIGKEDTLKIIRFFSESFDGLPIDCMYLVRHGEQGEAKKDLYMVPWHVDDYATLEITLNDDYEGGHVLHMNGDGIHKTEALPGSAIAHLDDVVHGITANVGGAKYMLILKHHFNRADKVGVVKLSEEMVNETSGH